MTDAQALLELAKQTSRELTGSQRSGWRTQEDAWPHALKAARQGNPFATLCEHCYGRHSPPRDHLCPHPNLQGARASSYLPLALSLDRDLLDALREYEFPGLKPRSRAAEISS